MVGVIISVILLIVGGYLTIDGYNTMTALWRDSNEIVLAIGIVILVIGIVTLLVSLVKMLKGKENHYPIKVVKYCDNCNEQIYRER